MKDLYMRIPGVILALFLVASPLYSFQVPDTAWFKAKLKKLPGIAWVDQQFTMVQLQANCSADTPDGTPIFTEPEKILQMYQLMKDVHEVFTHYKVTYWADSGTLLGAVRHQGIIPWDDDIDLCLDKKELESVYALKPIFDFLDYEVINLWGCFLRIQKKTNHDIFADLILTEQRNEKIYFAPYLPMHLYRLFYGDYGLYGYREGEEIYTTKDELYPLKEYKFGACTVMGPRDPMKYLESMYGKDVLDVAYQWHAHQDGQFFQHKKVKMHLTDKDRVPAQPVGPLRNRVAALIELLPSNRKLG